MIYFLYNPQPHPKANYLYNLVHFILQNMLAVVLDNFKTVLVGLFKVIGTY